MDLIAFIFGVLGFVFALGARQALKKLTVLEMPALARRIQDLEAQVARLAGTPSAPPAADAAAPEGTASGATGAAAPTPPEGAAAGEDKSGHEVATPADAPTGQPQVQPPAQAARTSVPASRTRLVATSSSGPAQTPATQAVSSPEVAHKPVQSLEERLGTRWAVWVGGVALALGGLLLVRYSIEQGLFGPELRIALGGLFSLALVALGEWFRRSERTLAVSAIPAAHVPSVLTAAGTTSAFATVYAAHALYSLIGAGPAFVLLGLIGVATMLAAALHGPALAGLGLAGALLVPMLITSPDPNPWALVLYLGAVAAAAYALARLRRWLWLAAGVVAGSVLWGFVLASPPAGIADSAAWTAALFSHTILQLALAAVFMALEPHLATADDDARPDWIAAAALAAVTWLALVALGQAPFDVMWGLFAVVATGILMATAWRSAPAAAAAPLGGVVALGAIATWPGLKEPPAATLLAPYAADVLRLPENVAGFLVFAVAMALSVTAVAGLRLARGRALDDKIAALYALAATVPLLLALVLVYLRVTQFDRSIPFALFALLEMGAFYAAARQFDGLAPVSRTSATRLATGAFAAAALAAIALALVMLLERGYLTVAFAAIAFTTASIATAMRLPLLRAVVVAIGFVVLGRILWDPRIMGDGVGTWPILNWLLLGYGAPALAFLAAGRTLRREREDLASRLCDALGLVFAALLGLFQIRHLVNGGDVLAAASSHIEQGLVAFLAIAFAYVLTRIDLGRGNVVFRFASYVAAIASALIVALSLGLFANPLLSGEVVKGPAVFSSLLLAYLLPGLAAVWLARTARGVRPEWYVAGAALAAIALCFGYVTLEVRHVFKGERIAFWLGADSAELWAYSVAWLLLGLAFLAYGIVRQAREARLASAALVILAVLKVFLFDLSGITGIWRALSFICLGAVLIGIGLVYQRLIFAKPGEERSLSAAGSRPDGD